MAAQPDVYFWQVTGGGAINNFGTGGASGTQVNSSYLDFSNDQAGFYTPPAILLVEFRNGGLAADIDLKIYDTDTSPAGGASSDPANQIVTSLGENLFSGGDANRWFFRIKCKETWQDPLDGALFGTDPASSAMASWSELKWGGTPYRLAVPGTGNDGTGNLLTPHVGDATRRFTNFFIYITALPKAAATAGDHRGWGMRTTFTYS